MKNPFFRVRTLKTIAAWKYTVIYRLWNDSIIKQVTYTVMHKIIQKDEISPVLEA